MTEERIENVVGKLKQIIESDYSDYAGFKLKPPEEGFNNCFIVNNEGLFPSNFSVELEDFYDSIKIIRKVTEQSEDEILKELDANGSFYYSNKPLYLHYLKLPKKCGE